MDSILLGTPEIICFFSWFHIWINDFPWIHIWILTWILCQDTSWFTRIHSISWNYARYYGFWPLFTGEIELEIMSEEYREEYREEYSKLMDNLYEFFIEFIGAVHTTELLEYSWISLRSFGFKDHLYSNFHHIKTEKDGHFQNLYLNSWTQVCL